MASFGELWFCVASVVDDGIVEGSMNEAILEANMQEAATRSLNLFELAISLFDLAGMRDTVKCADALKDFGKTKNAFFAENSGDNYLRESISLHHNLLGKKHPRSRNAARLLRH